MQEWLCALPTSSCRVHTLPMRRIRMRGLGNAGMAAFLVDVKADKVSGWSITSGALPRALPLLTLLAHGLGAAVVSTALYLTAS